MFILRKVNGDTVKTIRFNSLSEVALHVAALEMVPKDTVKQALKSDRKWAKGDKVYEVVEIDESKPVERFAYFDFDEERFLVKYESATDIGDEIEDALENYDWSDDQEYSQCVEDIMESFGVKWEKVPCRKYWV